MLNYVIYGMIYLGSALMVYNIYCYVQYIRRVRQIKHWVDDKGILNIPVFLLVMFLIGYLLVGLFGNPDLIISGILFGGSIFVFVIFLLLQKITDRIQESERLEGELKAAEASSLAKSNFLAGMSHEMRTPMNAILGLNSIALKNRDLPSETRTQLEKMRVSAQYLMDLINRILDINQIEAGEVVLEEDSFSIRELLNLIQVLSTSMCEDKGLDYRQENSGLKDQWFTGDVQKIREVLLCLIDNAVKFTDTPGTVTVTAEEVKDAPERSLIRFSVADTGIGMDPEFLPKLFDSFAREDESTTSRYGGSGVGLAYAKHITEAMKGTLTAESEKGVGSTFVFTVPLVPSEPKAEEGPVSLAGKRVLIAEDIALNAEILADLLEMEGISSERAENGRVAVRMFEEHPAGYYDAILMDLRMPEMDGLEATRQIRSMDRPDAKEIPIMALTANAFEEDKRKTREVGMNAHLSKPTDTDKLFKMLGILTARKKEAER